jgi:hypothetical protein
LRYYEIWIDKGDSTQFLIDTFITGGIEPVQYYWQPGESLQDSTVMPAWAKPDTTTEYSLVATDAIGCISFFNGSAQRYLPKGRFCSTKHQTQ